MKYEDMDDEALDRAVAERWEPNPEPGGGFLDPHTPGGGWVYRGSEPSVESDHGMIVSRYRPKYAARRFTTDPAAWGWLLEREGVSLKKTAKGWAAHHPAEAHNVWHGGNVTPGRAVCIAYLYATDS